MKSKILLSILALGLFISVLGQSTLELTFTAENNGEYVSLDSIFIENLTQGGDTTLYKPDTVLVLDYVTSISDNRAKGENSLSVSQNHPNPFKDKTQFNLYLAEEGNIQITGRDILGRELVHYENNLNRGNHSFTFYANGESYYLLTVSGNQINHTIKMLNVGNKTTNGEKCKLVYTGNIGDVSGIKSQRAINEFIFSLGDELKYSAYINVEETEIIDSPADSQIYTFQFDGWTPCSGPGTVTDIDGNVYNTVLIGNQCWMKENLKTTTYRNGSAIPNVTDANAWKQLSNGAYVWYDNDISWKESYGAIYNWTTTVDTNGLCPTGWHVPTNDEWTNLTDYIGGTDSQHGNELKSCRQVNSPLGGNCNISEHPRWSEYIYHYGTDDYAFSGLAGGFRSVDGNFTKIGYEGTWWSSTEDPTYPPIAWFRYLLFDSGFVYEGKSFKQSGMSVRCLRD